jgi:glycerate 2-kinase
LRQTLRTSSTRPVPLETLPDLTQLHRSAREIFDHALSSVDPRKAVKQAIKLNGPIVEIGEDCLDISLQSVYAIAIGKAATSMATGLEEALGDRLTAGIITSSSPIESKRWRSFAGGHPLPNEASLAAAQAAFELLDQANDAIVIFLISGGGSAMIEWPVSDDISLADLQAANKTLVTCGASISEVNAVRRAFSAVKGGALARRAPRTRMFTLIVSDTNREDEASVASGPTMNTPVDAPQAIEVVERYQLETRLPQSIVNAVRAAKHSTSMVGTSQAGRLDPAVGSHVVLLDNQTAVEAAYSRALALGFTCATLNDISEQPIETGCDLLLSRMFEESTDQPFCAISGGEFSCPVRGNGRGGRNLETVLRCAIRLDESRTNGRHFVVLSAGTDGIDGNSPAAGASADETTIERARALGLDARQYLARSDSYSFFEPLNSLVVTGQTGTNVRDLRIFLRAS